MVTAIFVLQSPTQLRNSDRLSNFDSFLFSSKSQYTQLLNWRRPLEYLLYLFGKKPSLVVMIDRI